MNLKFLQSTVNTLTPYYTLMSTIKSSKPYKTDNIRYGFTSWNSSQKCYIIMYPILISRNEGFWVIVYNTYLLKFNQNTNSTEKIFYIG